MLTFPGMVRYAVFDLASHSLLSSAFIFFFMTMAFSDLFTTSECLSCCGVLNNSLIFAMSAMRRPIGCTPNSFMSLFSIAANASPVIFSSVNLMKIEKRNISCIYMQVDHKIMQGQGIYFSYLSYL